MDHGASRGGVVVPPLIDSINLSIKGLFNELKNSFNEFLYQLKVLLKNSKNLSKTFSLGLRKV